MHQAHIAAERVLLNSGAYPEAVVAMATQIVADRVQHRQNIRALWGIHQVLKAWIRHRNEKIRSTKENGASISVFNANRFATMATTREFPHMMDTFHRGKNSFNTGYAVFNLTSSRFLSALKLVEESNLPLVHRYLACVNAERYDPSLGEVGYLRNIGHSVVCEILAWRLLQYPSPL